MKTLAEVAKEKEDMFLRVVYFPCRTNLSMEKLLS